MATHFFFQDSLLFCPISRAAGTEIVMTQPPIICGREDE